MKWSIATARNRLPIDASKFELHALGRLDDQRFLGFYDRP